MAPEDATAVRRLREAGAIIVGKHVTHEFVCGQDVPPTRSAWHSDHYPGGSSAGLGASVAVGSSLAAIGTDAGGSVRKPASINGVAGLKATYGRVSRHGVIPPTGTLDHVSIAARTVEDCALVLHEIAGPDPADPTALEEPVPDYAGALEEGLVGARLGVAGYFFGEKLEPEVRAPVEKALRELQQLGAELVPVELPSFELTLPVGFTILLAEGGASHLAWLRERTQDYFPDTRRMLELGALLPTGLVEAARRARSVMVREVKEAFRSTRLDALATPTLPRLSIPIDDFVIPVDLPRYIPFTLPFNLTGMPAITIPCGFSSTGLPVGLQLAGAPLAETTILRIAHTYEQATPWHERRPPITVAA
jgi:Asp-tRNA(Asn)/Glu-tRNA(Gln) amidotransferase A subunit family amidase